jgi:hypothetical protein
MALPKNCKICLYFVSVHKAVANSGDAYQVKFLYDLNSDANISITKETFSNPAEIISYYNLLSTDLLQSIDII